MNKDQLPYSIVSAFNACQDVEKELNLAICGIGDDMMDTLCKEISKSKTPIKRIMLRGNLLSSTGMLKLLRCLDNIGLATEINLDENPIDDYEMKEIGKLIANNKSFQRISLKKVKLTNSGVCDLVDNMHGNTSLKELNISQIKSLTDDIIPNLQEMIGSTSIWEVNVRATTIKKSNSLIPFILSNRIKNGLPVVDLSACGVRDNDIPLISKLIAERLYDNIEEINIGENAITSKGAIKIINLCKDILTLKKLKIRDNQINDEIILSFIDMIKDNTSIKYIDISGTLITNKFVEMLMSKIPKDSELVEIDISYCKGITCKSIPFIATLRKETRMHDIPTINTSIGFDTNPLFQILRNVNEYSTTFYFPNFEMHDEAVIPFMEALNIIGAKSIKNLILRNSRVTSKGAISLFEMLRDYNNLNQLELQHNLINDDCMDALGELLLDNPSITHIDISGCKLTNNGIEILCGKLFGNTSLLNIRLSDHPRIDKESFKHFMDLATMTAIEFIGISGCGIDEKTQQLIMDKLKIPSSNRPLPIQSKTKSAAKTQY